MTPCFRTALLVLGIVWAQVAIGATDQAKRSFTAEEKAQGYSNRTVLALPKEVAMVSQTLAQAESREKVRTVRHYPRFYGLRVIEAPGEESVDRYIKRLEATGLYAFVERDRLLYAQALPSDPDFVSGAQWSLRNTGQSNGKPGADIKAVDAWDVVTDASSVLVAVIDSGARLDLRTWWRISGGISESPETAGKTTASMTTATATSTMSSVSMPRLRAPIPIPATRLTTTG